MKAFGENSRFVSNTAKKKAFYLSYFLIVVTASVLIINFLLTNSYNIHTQSQSNTISKNYLLDNIVNKRNYYMKSFKNITHSHVIIHSPLIKITNNKTDKYITRNSIFSNDFRQALRLTIDNLKSVVFNIRKSTPVRKELFLNEYYFKLIRKLQNVTKCSLITDYKYNKMKLINKNSHNKYFAINFVIAIQLKFPSIMLSNYTKLRVSSNNTGIETLYVELAPIHILPHAVFTILEIVRTFHRGKFSRNDNHVLQSEIHAQFHGGVVFMEYDSRFPHEKYTLGFAGRGGGNGIYINTLNNTMLHGPGTNRGGKDPESDVCFGSILRGENLENKIGYKVSQNLTGEEIVHFMQKQPGGSGSTKFISGEENMIYILDMKLVSHTYLPLETSDLLEKNNIEKNKFKTANNLDKMDSNFSVTSSWLLKECETYCNTK